LRKKIGDKIKTHILCTVTFPPESCRLWDNVEKMWYSQTEYRWWYNTAHALGMLETKATDTHSEYVIFIGFPRPQWLRERAPMLLFTHITFWYPKILG